MFDSDAAPSEDENGRKDKIQKIRQLLTRLKSNFKKNAEVEKVLAVDEQIIPFKVG